MRETGGDNVSINMELLHGKMREKHISNEDMAVQIGVDASTFYRKIKANGVNFTVGQMHKIVEILRLTKEEAVSIFLW